MASRDLETRFTGDSSSLEAASARARGEMGKVEKGWSTAAKGMAAAGVAMAGAFVLDKVTEFASASLGLASDLEESMSKVGAVFGDWSVDMDQFIRDANKLNLSDVDAAALAGDLGNLAGQLGLANDESADLARGVMTLGADLGSFNNLDTADVIGRIQKAMTGELDGIKQLAPAMNAAMIAQRAMADTGKTSEDQLTAQEKALATYALLVEQSSAAIGDLEKTSGSAANQQKHLASKMEDAQTQLGEKLLPAWSGFLTFILDEALPGLQKLAAWFQEEVPPWYAQYVKPTVDAIVDVVVVAVDLIMLAWRTFGSTIVTYLVNTFKTLMSIIQGALKVITGIINVVLGVLTGDWGRAWNGLKGVVSGVLTVVKGFFTQLLRFVKLPLQLLGDLLEEPWNAMKSAALGVFNAIARAWNSTVGKLEFKAPSWVPGLGGKGFEVPDIPTVGGRMAAMAPVTLIMPEGSSGYSMVTTLRQYQRAGGNTALNRVAIA